MSYYMIVDRSTRKPESEASTLPPDLDTVKYEAIDVGVAPARGEVWDRATETFMARTRPISDPPDVAAAKASAAKASADRTLQDVGDMLAALTSRFL